MTRRPNVLWLMSDQHNANCAGYAGHALVRTPNLDRIAERGVQFSSAFANNPICSPSRICFMTGQYVHTHGMVINNHTDYPEPNPDTLACVFRRYGYQTALIGKSHMVRRWDEDGCEHIRYTNLVDARAGDPRTVHYFKYMEEHGLADEWEGGTGLPGCSPAHFTDGSRPSAIPYEHSYEAYTGNEAVAFLNGRDRSRPFFLNVTFDRPHAPITPSPEHFDLYCPDDIALPQSALDYFDNRFAGKPDHVRERVANGCDYPLAGPDPQRLKRCLASYYALITVIDEQIGRVLDTLQESGELENTVVAYVADHGDFAGEHGLFHKNLGMYDSIQRIPLLLSWPDGPQGRRCDEIVESVDLYPTLCALCNVPLPDGREGIDLVPVAEGRQPGKPAAYCEHAGTCAIRTRHHRAVFYGADKEGELYDLADDPGETRNLWNDPSQRQTRLELTARLLEFTMQHRTVTGPGRDKPWLEHFSHAPTYWIGHRGHRWSQLPAGQEGQDTGK